MARSPKTAALFVALPPAQPEVKPVVRRDDRPWKELTTSANAAFAAKRWDVAERLYLEALAEADTIFNAWCEGRLAGDADPAPMLVVATANLVECWLAAGEAVRAADHLVALRRRLCAAIDARETKPDVRDQCFQQLHPLLAELLDKLPRAGWPQGRTESEALQVKNVALRYLARNTTTH
jgi:hypothetical protein